MCGIAGFWRTSTPDFEVEPTLEKMALAMRLRGPDAQDYHFDPSTGVGLAHARLAILDLSPNGVQPMHCSTGRYTIVYNGEVYNFAAIRDALDSSGATPSGGWKGGSDTEVILQAIVHWGLEQTVAQCIGMFAFALFDRKQQSLTFVRDRLGIKPLHYGLAGRDLVFGSELKPIMAYPHLQPQVHRDALQPLLQTLYIPAPYSILQGISKLPPGHMLTICKNDIERGELPEPSCYWSLNKVAENGIASRIKDDPHAALEQLEEILGDAVKLRLVADVPLGAFLSGGIDSSSVVALMSRVATDTVKTFSIGFEDPEYNEAEHAKAIANHLGTEHTELYVTPDDALAEVGNLARHYDEPFADASQIPTLLVSRMAREHVTVSLSGDGGDELFAGYNRYTFAPKLWNIFSRIPAPVRSAASCILRNGGESTFLGIYGQGRKLLSRENRHFILRDKLQKITEALPRRTREEFFHSLASYWQYPSRIVRNSATLQTRFTNSAQWPVIDDFCEFMMAMDQTTYLPDDILTKVDRASMAASLEARVPIIDHRVVEFAWSVPLSLKMRDGKSKWLLRQLLYKHVPQELVERPKQGFAVPIAQWLRGPLRDWSEELLAEKRLREEGFFDAKAIRTMLNDHQQGKRNYQYHLWPVLMFQAWQDEYIFR